MKGTRKNGNELFPFSEPTLCPFLTLLCPPPNSPQAQNAPSPVTVHIVFKVLSDIQDEIVLVSSETCTICYC